MLGPCLEGASAAAGGVHPGCIRGASGCIRALAVDVASQFLQCLGLVWRVHLPHAVQLYIILEGEEEGAGCGNPGPTLNSRILTAPKFPNANASRTSTAPKCPNANATTNRPGLNQTGAKFRLRSAGAAGAQGLQLRSVAAANSQKSRGECDPSVR